MFNPLPYCAISDLMASFSIYTASEEFTKVPLCKYIASSCCCCWHFLLQPALITVSSFWERLMIYSSLPNVPKGYTKSLAPALLDQLQTTVEVLEHGQHFWFQLQ